MLIFRSLIINLTYHTLAACCATDPVKSETDVVIGNVDTDSVTAWTFPCLNTHVEMFLHLYTNETNLDIIIVVSHVNYAWTVDPHAYLYQFH